MKLRRDDANQEALAGQATVAGMFAGLLAFSLTGFFASVAALERTTLSLIAAVFFVFSSGAWGSALMTRTFILAKSSGAHIGHIIVAEDYSKHSLVAGIVFLYSATLVFCLGVSVYLAAAFIVTHAIFFRQHRKFLQKFKSLPHYSEIP